MGLSRADRLRAMPWAERSALLDRLGPEACAALRLDWNFWARPEQLAPGSSESAIDRDDWSFWLILAGRGFGKTRAGSEWCVEQARKHPGSHGALVGATAADVRDTMLSAGQEMVDGASGILAISPPDFMPIYEPSKRILTWPNDTVGTLYSAEEPDRMRGPQHHWGWADELAAWKRLQDTWDMLMFGMRLGKSPRMCITTTPRPLPAIKDLLKNQRTVVTRGSTYDNRSNLAEVFFDSIISKYEGTRLGRQELHAELLDDIQGALWNLAMIDAARVVEEEVPALLRVTVAVDPAVSTSEKSDETGIVAGGVGLCSCKGTPELHAFVMRDHSGKYSPNGWGSEAVALYNRLHADRIVAEVNNGGDLVENNLRTVDQAVSYRAVHASRGKLTRAEPVAALYEQGKVHHVGGGLVKLEDQQTQWDPTAKMKSPDRMDALVYLITDLMIENRPSLPMSGPMNIPILGMKESWGVGR